MSQRSRNQLHLSKLEEFAAWAAGRGYVREEPKGYYEILRLRRGGSPPLLYFARAGAREHATAQGGAAAGLVNRWLREKRKGPRS